MASLPGPGSAAPPALAQRQAPLAVSRPLWQLLQQAYASPPRAYHHLGHIEEVIGWFDWAHRRAPWRAPREVYVALLFHDAIYVPGAKDNEARSAELAAEAIAGRSAAGPLVELADVDAARVAELIGWTAQHGRLTADEVDEEAARFLDCDLAILAAAPARYQRYCDEIAAEYAALPPAAYQAGRRAFVAGLLARPRRFLSELFHRELDERARDNLTEELARLEALVR